MMVSLLGCLSLVVPKECFLGVQIYSAASLNFLCAGQALLREHLFAETTTSRLEAAHLKHAARLRHCVASRRPQRDGRPWSSRKPVRIKTPTAAPEPPRRRKVDCTQLHEAGLEGSSAQERPSSQDQGPSCISVGAG